MTFGQGASFCCFRTGTRWISHIKTLWSSFSYKLQHKFCFTITSILATWYEAIKYLHLPWQKSSCSSRWKAMHKHLHLAVIAHVATVWLPEQDMLAFLLINFFSVCLRNSCCGRADVSGRDAPSNGCRAKSQMDYYNATPVFALAS